MMLQAYSFTIRKCCNTPTALRVWCTLISANFECISGSAAASYMHISDAGVRRGVDGTRLLQELQHLRGLHNTHAVEKGC